MVSTQQRIAKLEKTMGNSEMQITLNASQAEILCVALEMYKHHVENRAKQKDDAGKLTEEDAKKLAKLHDTAVEIEQKVLSSEYGLKTM